MRANATRLLLLAAAASWASTAAAEDWAHSITPYIWSAGLSGDSGVPPLVASVDQGFGDILEVTELALFGHYRATREGWTVDADLIFVGLGDTVGPAIAPINYDIDQTILSVAGGYRASERLTWLFGLRYVGLDTRFDFTVPATTFAGDDSWVDPFVGVRYVSQLGDEWDLESSFDMGGFGVGSDFTYNLALVANWNHWKDKRLSLGYRRLDIDYDDGLVYDMALHGLVVGFGWDF